jgi:flagellar motility protein MotE (MotC chaperone)
MKAKLVYGVVFGLAFVLVTVGIIFMNSKYNNIFKFDFRPPQPVSTHVAAKPAASEKQNDDSLQVEQAEEFTEPVPDVKETNVVENKEKKDSATAKPKMTSSVYDSLKILKTRIAMLEKQNKAAKSKAKSDEELKAQQRKMDSTRVASIGSKKLEEWAKTTAKLYDSMDPKKAAKIIQSYSDNESREILFKMNKKKAAKVLSELDPETAHRITKAL